MTGKGWRRTRKEPGREKQRERVGEGVGEEEGVRGVCGGGGDDQGGEGGRGRRRCVLKYTHTKEKPKLRKTALPALPPAAAALLCTTGISVQLYM